MERSCNQGHAFPTGKSEVYDCFSQRRVTWLSSNKDRQLARNPIQPCHAAHQAFDSTAITAHFRTGTPRSRLLSLSFPDLVQWPVLHFNNVRRNLPMHPKGEILESIIAGTLCQY